MHTSCSFIKHRSAASTCGKSRQATPALLHRNVFPCQGASIDIPPNNARPTAAGAPLLQAALLDSLFGTERGLTPTAETRGEISELISQLEAGTPNAAPNEVSPPVDRQPDMAHSWRLGKPVMAGANVVEAMVFAA